MSTEQQPKGKAKSTAKEPSIDELQSYIASIEEEERKAKEEQERVLKALADKRAQALESIKAREEQDKNDVASKFVPHLDVIKKRGYTVVDILNKAFEQADIKDVFISAQDPLELNKEIAALKAKIKKQDKPEGSSTRTRTVYVKYNRADYESDNPKYSPISFGGVGDKAIKEWWSTLSPDQQATSKAIVADVDPVLAGYLLKCAERMGTSKTVIKKYPHLLTL